MNTKTKEIPFKVKHQGKITNFYLSNIEDIIQKNIARGHFFEIEELEQIQSLRLSGTCLDIGANIGNHTLFFAQHCDFSNVFPFEPMEDIAAMLRKNIVANGDLPINLSHLGVALGASNETGEAVLKNPNNLGASRVEANQEGQVKIRNGDEVCREIENVSFMKIDVEGMEIDVLNGLERTILKHHPYIYIEVSNRFLPAFGRWCKKQSYVVDQVISEKKYKKNFLIRAS